MSLVSTVRSVPVEAYETVRYRCPHCRRSFAGKTYAQSHADMCASDPEQRACRTCKHHYICCESPDPRITQCGCGGGWQCQVGLVEASMDAMYLRGCEGWKKPDD